LVAHHVLALNAGSSSIKFALFEMGDRDPPQRSLSGQIDHIGSAECELSFGGPEGRRRDRLPVGASDHRSAAEALIDWLEQRHGLETIDAAGHRVVHGMGHEAPERITRDLLDKLRSIRPYDPDHLPREIELIEAFHESHPQLLQIACFDSYFHRTLPRVARILPIPRRFFNAGIERLGFHGLSYAYLVEELQRLASPRSAAGRVILAHLGSGASLAAVVDGRSVDTTMGFTPAGGLPMSTRPGDLDPGLAWRVMKTEGLGPEAVNRMIHEESGLLGVSGTSGDMRVLLDRQTEDPRAADAVELFCYQTRKGIGAYAAVLEGLDVLVFSGGIGEHAPEVRNGICRGLGFLGIELDETANAEGKPLISAPSSEVEVRVIPTDEELMIARAVSKLVV
jgi:acetate kinase